MAIRSTPMRHLLMIIVTTLFLVLVQSVTAISDDVKCNCSRPVDRSSFPSDFVFGGGEAAYQFEGAYKEDGKGPSVWDYFTHKYPEKITDHSNGDVADNSYHLYREDIHIVKDMGFDYYRFSISWSRILPHGRLSGGFNSKGIKYYNDIINELLAKGIKPIVTMFHFDIPLALENEYGGLLSPKFAIDFRAYADILFHQYGDRVKLWTTINEPWTNSNNAYATGSMAPGRCSAWQHNNCTGGDSGTEPYIVTHNQLLAHAAAVQLYREKYQLWQQGEIGITLNAHWYIPYNVSSVLDHQAAQRSRDFMHGWFLHPLTYGTYPKSMQQLVKDRLPKFTRKQAELVKGSFDFMGINYYTTYYAINVNETDPNHLSYLTDSHANTTSFDINGNPIGDKSGSSWLYVYPRGFRELLAYIKKYYKNPTIYITENGVSETNNETIPLFEQLLDFKRIDYYKEHFCCLHKSIYDDEVVVKGYMAWSLLDNFEWASGFSERFGLNYVDYKSSSLTRYSKLSALWLKSMLRAGDRPMPVQLQVSSI